MPEHKLHDTLVARNTYDVYEAFKENPNNILVSVQLVEEQKEHLDSGLSKRSRRLIPLPLLAKMLKEC